MVGKKMAHIDDAQPKSVDDHFELIMSNREIIDDESAELTSDDLPEWYDNRLFNIGQEFYKKNLLGFGTAGLAGLLAVLSVPEILKILIYTNQSSTPCTAFKRYLETLLHTYIWYVTNPTDSKRWYKSLNTVRWKHSLNSKRSKIAGHGGITQRDMVLTQFGFLGFVLVAPAKLGIVSSAEEREGLVHYWRVFGHMLGISDSLNLCRKTAAETTQLCVRIQYDVYRKYFLNATKEFKQMTEALVSGLWTSDMILDYDAFMHFTYSLMDIPYDKPLGLYSWLNHKYRVTIFYLCSLPIIGYVVRTYFNCLLAINYWLLEKFPIQAAIRFGRKESQINLYPKYHG